MVGELHLLRGMKRTWWIWGILIGLAQFVQGQESVIRLPLMIPIENGAGSLFQNLEAYNHKIDALMRDDHEFYAALKEYVTLGQAPETINRRYEAYYKLQDLILKDPYSNDYTRRIKILAELVRRSDAVEDTETASLYTEVIYAIEDHWILTFLDDFLDPDLDSSSRITEWVGGTFATILIGALLMRGQFMKVLGGRLTQGFGGKFVQGLPDFTSRLIRKMLQPITSLLRKSSIPVLGMLERFVGPLTATTQFGAAFAQGSKWEQKVSYLKTPRSDRPQIKLFPEPLAVAGLAESSSIRRPVPYFDYLDWKSAAVLPSAAIIGFVGHTYARQYSRIYIQRFADAAVRAQAVAEEASSFYARVPKGVVHYAGKVGKSAANFSIPGVVVGTAISIGLPMAADYLVDEHYKGKRERELKAQMALLPTIAGSSDVITYREAIKTWVVMSERISFDQVPVQNEYQKILMEYQQLKICAAYAAPVSADYPGYWGLDVQPDIEFGKTVEKKLDATFEKNVRLISTRATERFPYDVSLIDNFQVWLDKQVKTGPMNDLIAKVGRNKMVLKRMISEGGLKDVSDYYLANDTLRGVDVYRQEILDARRGRIIPLKVLEKLEARAEADGPGSAAARLLQNDRIQASAEYHIQKSKFSCFAPWEMYETDTRAAF